MKVVKNEIDLLTLEASFFESGVALLKKFGIFKF